MNRVRAGSCRVVNPFSGRSYLVPLKPEDVLAVVFWTRNPVPLMPYLAELEDRGIPYYFQFTITPYGRAFEPGVPPAGRAMDAARRLAERIGPDLVVWRYDPIVETTITPWSWHIERFGRMAEELRGTVRRCVFSFMNLYRRTRLRMDELAVRHGFEYRFLAIRPREIPLSSCGLPYELEEMKERSRQLAAIAAAERIRLEACCCPELIDPAAGVAGARCVDPDLIALARKQPVALEPRPTRPGCGCVESRDIGAYETCTHGCGASYCYAVQYPEKARRNRRLHDPEQDMLGPAEKQA